MTTCIYKTVTLAPNEPFNLPPGAELVSATDPSKLTSTCPLPATLEALTCYGFVLIAHTGGSGSITFEDDQTTYEGISINGVYYPFSAPVGFNPAAVQAEIEALSIGSAFSGFCISTNSYLPNSVKYYLMFKTIPSIGNDLQLIGSTVAGNSGTGLPQAPFTLPAETRTAITGAGHTGVCSCL